MVFVPPNHNYLAAAIILKELAFFGCKQVVISPGSRSTPLAHTAIALGYFRTYVIHDERSAGYFALGLAKADRVPAMLICTSGTAAANYFPAVIEARQSLTPLVLLTADRPSRLRNTGAPQTIDQTNLYGRYANAYFECELVDHSDDSLNDLRGSLLEILHVFQYETPGPLHVNVCFDEPLAPLSVHATEVARAWKNILSILPVSESGHEHDLPDHVHRHRTGSHADENHARAVERISESQSGLIVCGPDSARTNNEADAIGSLARHLGWPVLADIASGLRFSGDPVIPYYDLLLRREDYKSLAPDVVIAFGAHPTSRSLNDYLDQHRTAFTIRVQPHRRPWDPHARAALRLHHAARDFLQIVSDEITASRDSLLLDSFQQAANGIRAGLSMLNADAWKEAELVYVSAAIRALPGETNLVLANSMPIRYADMLAAYEGNTFNVYGMRGANGIDGTILHAVGVAAASAAPTLLITGDLAFLHDLNGCAAASYFASQLDILLLDNNGGGIFHFLPVHDHDPLFDTLHATPHDLNLAAAKDLFQLEWYVVKSPSELIAGMSVQHARPRVFHVRTDRDTNYRSHIQLVELLLQRTIA